MYYKHFFKFLIVILFFRIIFSEEIITIQELFSKFTYERKMSNNENAEKLADQIIANFELDPKLSKDDFINHLEFFGEFYLEIEKDSIANLLFFRSAKIIENEIFRYQKKLINPIKKLDEIYISNSQYFNQSPYSQLLNDISDTNRLDKIDSISISPLTIWFPEIRYLDFHSDSVENVKIVNDNTAIELFNIANSYFRQGLYLDAFELLSQIVIMENKFITCDLFINTLFTNSDTTQLFLQNILEVDSLKIFSPEKKFIIALAQKKLGNYQIALEYILEFQNRFPNTSQLNLLIGDIYFELENWFESLIYYHWEVQQSPESISAKIGFSLSMMNRGDLQGARIVLEKLIKKEIIDYRIYLTLGKIYLFENKIELAIQQFRKSLKLDSKIPEIHFNLGLAHFKSGQLNKALVSFERSTSLDKENGKYHYYLGQVNEKVLKIDEAINNYVITRKFNPEITDVNRRLGLLLFDKELYRKAVEPLREYIIHYPDSTRILSIFSEVLLKESRFPEAIDGYNRLIQFQPSKIENYIYLANAYKELSDYANAMETYLEALKYNDEISDLYIELGIVSYELKLYNKTIEYLNESIKCISPDFNTNYLLGLAYGNLGKNMQALLAFKQASIQDSTDMTIAFQMGVLYMELFLFNDALIEFKKYEIEYPYDSVVQFLIGKCFYHIGEYESAKLKFELTLKLNSNDTDSQFYIGLCLKQMGDLENAAIALKKATLLDPDNHLYHFEIGQIYLAIGKLRLAYNEANILKLLGSKYYDSLNSLIEFNIIEGDSSITTELELD